MKCKFPHVLSPTSDLERSQAYQQTLKKYKKGQKLDFRIYPKNSKEPISSLIQAFLPLNSLSRNLKRDLNDINLRLSTKFSGKPAQHSTPAITHNKYSRNQPAIKEEFDLDLDNYGRDNLFKKSEKTKRSNVFFGKQSNNNLKQSGIRIDRGNGAAHQNIPSNNQDAWDFGDTPNKARKSKRKSKRDNHHHKAHKHAHNHNSHSHSHPHNLNELKPATDSQVVGTKDVGKNIDLELAAQDAEFEEQIECRFCGRSFGRKVIQKHEKICKKNALQKRKKFDSQKKRVEGEAKTLMKQNARQNAINEKYKPKKNWQKESEAFRDMIKANRKMKLKTDGEKSVKAKHKGGGGKGKVGGGNRRGGGPGAMRGVDGAMKAIEKDRVTCELCGGKFSVEGLKRHQPLCRSKKNYKTGGRRR